MTIPEHNPQLELARDFVQTSGSHIFLTGRAGTGKTTFLHSLKGNTAKRMVVTAPTGVAAINAGGVTLHSFFQLPFGPFLPGSERFDEKRRRFFRFSREKRRIIDHLDLLVIDEISMVRADLLDSVDAVLRRLRRRETPFGGVQLLMIGDLYQLPPVVKADEWRLLQQHYASAYFFSSHTLARTEMVTIELEHIYRQSDPRFIGLLNRVRNNRIDDQTLSELNRRHVNHDASEEHPGVITLTTHNRGAEAINAAKLAALPGRPHDRTAVVEGQFPESSYPTPGTLRLKTGAQVMFLRNDPAPEKRYFNGKIGKITAVSVETVRVSCPGEAEPVVVAPVVWENIQYSLDEEKGEIEARVAGTFKQFPLKLAWAITIHKSQGLTFEKAVIDAQDCFAHGQLYVALSRCRSLEGLTLSSPLPVRGIGADEAILAFVRQARDQAPSEETLQKAQRAYQQRLLMDCFDFQALNGRLNHLARLLEGNTDRLRVTGTADIRRVQALAAEDIFRVAARFRRQLRGLIADRKLPAADATVRERVCKASGWFQETFARCFDDLMQTLRVETDNQELDRRIGNALLNLRREIAVKLAGITSCEKGFSPARYLRALSAADTQAPVGKQHTAAVPDDGESDIEHTELFETLKDWRARMASEREVPHYQVLHQRVLIALAVHLPDTAADLSRIKGVGKKTVAKYGEELLALIRAYRAKHGIAGAVPTEAPGPAASRKGAPPKPHRPDTRRISLSMFDDGLSLARIAEERGLALSTIEGHLCTFVENGELDIDRVVAKARREVIERAMDAAGIASLKAVKQALGDGYSYGEIKMVMARRRSRTVESEAAEDGTDDH